MFSFFLLLILSPLSLSSQKLFLPSNRRQQNRPQEAHSQASIHPHILLYSLAFPSYTEAAAEFPMFAGGPTEARSESAKKKRGVLDHRYVMSPIHKHVTVAVRHVQSRFMAPTATPTRTNKLSSSATPGSAARDRPTSAPRTRPSSAAAPSSQPKFHSFFVH